MQQQKIKTFRKQSIFRGWRRVIEKEKQSFRSFILVKHRNQMRRKTRLFQLLIENRQKNIKLRHMLYHLKALRQVRLKRIVLKALKDNTRQTELQIQFQHRLRRAYSNYLQHNYFKTLKQAVQLRKMTRLAFLFYTYSIKKRYFNRIKNQKLLARMNHAAMKKKILIGHARKPVHLKRQYFTAWVRIVSQQSRAVVLAYQHGQSRQRRVLSNCFRILVRNRILQQRRRSLLIQCQVIRNLASKQAVFKQLQHHRTLRIRFRRNNNYLRESQLRKYILLWNMCLHNRISSRNTTAQSHYHRQLLRKYLRILQLHGQKFSSLFRLEVSLIRSSKRRLLQSKFSQWLRQHQRLKHVINLKGLLDKFQLRLGFIALTDLYRSLMMQDRADRGAMRYYKQSLFVAWKRLTKIGLYRLQQQRRARQHAARSIKQQILRGWQKRTKHQQIIRERIPLFIEERQQRLLVEVLKFLNKYALYHHRKRTHLEKMTRQVSQLRQTKVIAQWRRLSLRHLAKSKYRNQRVRQVVRSRVCHIFTRWKRLSAINTEILRYKGQIIHEKRRLFYSKQLLIRLQANQRLQVKGKCIQSKKDYRRGKTTMMFWFLLAYNLQQRRQRLNQFTQKLAQKKELEVIQRLRENVVQNRNQAMKLRILRSQQAYQRKRSVFQAIKVYSLTRRDEYNQERYYLEMHKLKLQRDNQRKFDLFIDRVYTTISKGKTQTMVAKSIREAQLAMKYVERWREFIRRRRSSKRYPTKQSVKPTQMVQSRAVKPFQEVQIQRQKKPQQQQQIEKQNESFIQSRMKEVEQILQFKVQYYERLRANQAPNLSQYRQEIRSLVKELQDLRSEMQS